MGPVCFPSLPQELASFQEQWERWSLGQVGFDKRTNVSVRYLQRDRLGYWTCQFCTGQTCFLAVHSDYEDWGQIFPGDALIAFQVHQIGCYKGCPLIAVPKIGSGSSLIKQPCRYRDCRYASHSLRIICRHWWMECWVGLI